MIVVVVLDRSKCTLWVGVKNEVLVVRRYSYDDGGSFENFFFEMSDCVDFRVLIRSKRNYQKVVSASNGGG